MNVTAFTQESFGLGKKIDGKMKTKEETHGNDDFHIAPAEVRFARELLAIYRPYVTQTAVSFELEPPTRKEFARRIRTTLANGRPWLMARVGGRIVGYAYASPLKNRAAYAPSVEVSIYLDVNERRKGYGRRLYAALEDELRTSGVSNAYACIAYPERRDPWLTRDSVRFHAALGFRRVGKFTDCAEKFGRPYSVVWMEKRLTRGESRRASGRGRRKMV